MKQERKTKGLSSISNVISPFAKNIIGKRGFVEVDIITNWNNIVGDELAEFSIPQNINFPKNKKNDGVLNIQVSSGAFALEVQHREKIIIEKINSYFGYNAISKIKVTQNHFIKEADFDNKDKEKHKIRLVTKEEENYIDETVKNLENKKLEMVLKQLGHSIVVANREKEKENDF